MTTQLQTVATDDRLDVAAGIMDRHGVRQIIVVDQAGQLTGLVSYRVLLRVVATRRLEALEAGDILVRDVMERDPLTFSPETSLLDAIRALMSSRASAAPVLDGDRLVGVVSEHDIVALASRMLDDGE